MSAYIIVGLMVVLLIWLALEVCLAYAERVNRNDEPSAYRMTDDERVQRIVAVSRPAPLEPQ